MSYQGVFCDPPPCRYDCDRRRSGCHASCEEYVTWRAEYDKLKAERDKAVARVKDIDEYAKALTRRIKGYSGQNK